MIHTNHITVTKTARYFTSGNLNEHTTEIWIVIHGYAQLASDFIKKFAPLFSKNRYFLAPEGLNRFYAKGFGGKPAATWMTSEDRECEILDYSNYLETLLNQIVPVDYRGKIILLGFSQGVATASRWLNASQKQFDLFMLCSGDIAMELRNPVSRALLQVPCVYITGNDDPFLDAHKTNEIHLLMEEIKAHTIYFDGGHQIDIPSILKGISVPFSP